MNAKELYLTIGQISDNLILDADTEHGKKKKPTIRFWAIATAACFCLMLGSGYLHFFGTSAVWNTGTIEFVSKVSIPENSTIQILTTEDMTEYYHITPPDALGDMSRIPTDAQIYTYAQGGVLYDRNEFYYESKDGNKNLILTLSRVSLIPQRGDEKISRIQGVSIILTEDESVQGQPLLSAQWEYDETSAHLSSKGLNQDELITVLKQLL